jgi:multiple sugar transport system permease protein
MTELSRGKRTRKVKDFLIAAAFIFPGALCIFIFKYLMSAQSLIYSFFDYNYVDPSNSTFIGLDNYIAVLSKHSWFWPQLKNTLILWAYSLCFGFITPIIQALLLNEIKGKGRVLARYLYVLPAAVPGVAGLAVWRYIWDPQAGIANMIIGAFGVGPQRWLGDENLIKLTLSLPGLLGGGLNLLIYLIAIEGINPELYEASALDGATRFKMMLFITLPQIAYMISIQLLLSISGSLLAFDTPYIMTDGKGGPGTPPAATTIVFGIYTKAYNELDFGQGMAMSMIVLAITLVMTLIKQTVEKKFES